MAENSWQSYEKSINTIELNALAAESWSFSESERNTIDQIAALCPLAAGNAVYRARRLQEYYRVPDWSADCAPVADRSNNADAAGQETPVLFPNPANGQVELMFAQGAPAGSSVQLAGLSGQVLRVIPVESGRVRIAIDLAEIPNGCYFVQVCNPERTHSTQKLIVIH